MVFYYERATLGFFEGVRGDNVVFKKVGSMARRRSLLKETIYAKKPLARVFSDW